MNTSSELRVDMPRRERRRLQKAKQRRNARIGTLAGVAATAIAVAGIAQQSATADHEEVEALSTERLVSTIPANTLHVDEAAVKSAGSDMAASRMGISSIADADDKEGSISVAGYAEEQAGPTNGARVLPGNIVLSHPVASTRISSPFGHRSNPTGAGAHFHIGQDYPVPTGTAVHASAGGTVVFAGWHSTGGNRVEIDHGNGIVTAYSHNSSLNVRVGEQVSAGQVVALAGSTGNSTGPHVHFEVKVDDKWVDPAIYLP